MRTRDTYRRRATRVHETTTNLENKAEAWSAAANGTPDQRRWKRRARVEMLDAALDYAAAVRGMARRK